MEDPSSPSFLSVLLGWIPMLLLFGVWFVFMRGQRRHQPPPDYWEDQLAVDKETLEARRETNRLLAELAAKLNR